MKVKILKPLFKGKKDSKSKNMKQNYKLRIQMHFVPSNDNIVTSKMDSVEYR